MLDTLLARFPNVHLIIVGDNDYLFNGADPRVVTLYERPSDRKWAQSIREDAVREGTTAVVVTRLPKSSVAGGLYSLPFGMVACADVVVEMTTETSYNVLKNRFGRTDIVWAPVPVPEPPDLIPESAMTNDDINASSSSLPIAATPEATAMTTETDYAAACLPDRLRCAAHLDRVHFDVPTDEQELVSVLDEAANRLEAADALLSLSAAYRAAHAAYVEAVASERAAYLVSTNDPGLARAACTALAAAKQALLCAALDIT